MAGRWRKAKMALGLNLCVYVPNKEEEEQQQQQQRDDDDDDDASLDAAAPSPPSSSSSQVQQQQQQPLTPIPTSSRLSKKTCAICLGTMKPGHGHALFTAECSHTFHFHCIASNVRYGNHVCPVCRAKWKEIPFQGPSSADLPLGRTRVNPVNWSQDDGHMTLLQRVPRDNSPRGQHPVESLFQSSEPAIFDDDEPSESQSEAAPYSQINCNQAVDVKTYPELSAIPQSASLEDFTILIHLKAPLASIVQSSAMNIHSNPVSSQTSRAPVDLVTVLDVSGSMAGIKLALLKRAMGFVIQNLGPSDRLSVISFSSTARRLFHLRRMSEPGKQQALQAINSLVSNGGTNIAAGLSKAAKVIEERKEKNPVCSIILLSDGQDTYTTTTSSGGAHNTQPYYQALVPSSIRGGTGHRIPVHAFGFGADHDSSLMHSVSEASGGTFSFIEAESVIQDAFAQCIGGLLSVVVQEMRVVVECVHEGVRLGSIKSGSYANRVLDDGLTGSIDVGDLYADEDRDFLVSVNVPPAREDIVLLKVGCYYRDPLSKEMVNLESKEVKVQRPEFVVAQIMSIEVDRQRNRLHAAEAMAQARAAAERGAFSEGVSILEGYRKLLSESLSGHSGDELCVGLDAELLEMQERMASRQRYEASGRAYVLSGLSSHSWQRATARGDSTDSGSLVHAYQTPSMVNMLQRSQTLSPAVRRPKPPIQPSRSFVMQPEPR